MKITHYSPLVSKELSHEKCKYPVTLMVSYHPYWEIHCGKCGMHFFVFFTKASTLVNASVDDMYERIPLMVVRTGCTFTLSYHCR